MHTAWQRLEMDTRDGQLRRVVRKACNWLKRVRSAAVVRFFERYVVELEKQLRIGISTDSSETSNRCNWRRQGRWNHSASVTRKGDCCATKGVSARGEWDSSFTAELLIRHARCRHTEEATAAPSRECPRDGAHGGRDCHSDEGNGKRESGGTGWPSRRTTETRTSTRPDHPAGAPSAYHPHLAPGESPTAVEICGHYSTPQEGRQDGVRKLPQHLARVTRG